jgi:hypothetical protein
MAFCSDPLRHIHGEVVSFKGGSGLGGSALYTSIISGQASSPKSRGHKLTTIIVKSQLLERRGGETRNCLG